MKARAKFPSRIQVNYLTSGFMKKGNFPAHALPDQKTKSPGLATGALNYN